MQIWGQGRRQLLVYLQARVEPPAKLACGPNYSVAGETPLPFNLFESPSPGGGSAVYRRRQRRPGDDYMSSPLAFLHPHNPNPTERKPTGVRFSPRMRRLPDSEACSTAPNWSVSTSVSMLGRRVASISTIRASFGAPSSQEYLSPVVEHHQRQPGLPSARRLLVQF